MAANSMGAWTGNEGFGPASHSVSDIGWSQRAQMEQQRALEAQQYQQNLAWSKQKWADQMAIYQDILGAQRQQVGGFTDLINQYNQSFAAAKAANEAKYREALGVVDKTSGQQAADVRSQYAQQRASALQNLARTGMSNTTVGATLSQGLGREQAASLNRVSDEMLKTKLGVMQGFEYKYPEAGITETAISALAPKWSFPSFG